MAADDARPSTSSRISSLSASATVVPGSTENTPQIHDGAAFSHGDSNCDGLESSDGDDEEPPEPPWPEEPIQGWPQLALMMAKTPDFAAFPRFRDLNTKSLLYYQAQLTLYRNKLHELEYSDAQKNIWHERADKLVETDSEQFKTVMEMRKVLKEYSEYFVRNPPRVMAG